MVIVITRMHRWTFRARATFSTVEIAVTCAIFPHKIHCGLLLLYSFKYPNGMAYDFMLVGDIHPGFRFD
jgi:hypothetical protein